MCPSPLPQCHATNTRNGFKHHTGSAAPHLFACRSSSCSHSHACDALAIVAFDSPPGAVVGRAVRLPPLPVGCKLGATRGDRLAKPNHHILCIQGQHEQHKWRPQGGADACNHSQAGRFAVHPWSKHVTFAQNRWRGCAFYAGQPHSQRQRHRRHNRWNHSPARLHPRITATVLHADQTSMNGAELYP